MKYFFNKINHNYCQDKPEEPFYTFTPPPICQNEEFPRYNLAINQWQICNKSNKDLYFNFDTLEIKYLDYKEVEEFDLTNFKFGILKNVGDVIIELDQAIYYEVASNATLSFFKRKQLAKLKIAYEKAQVAKIINGITFFTPLMGEFYNTTAQVRKSKAEARNDKLMYIRVPAIDNKEYESELPVDFYNLIDNKLDEISLQNNKIKRRYEIEIANFTKVDEIISLQFNFPAIQDININNLADDFIANTSNRKEDRDYLASLDKKFFIEFI